MTELCLVILLDKIRVLYTCCEWITDIEGVFLDPMVPRCEALMNVDVKLRKLGW